MTEIDTAGLAAVLPANPNLKGLSRLTAALNTHLYQLPDALLVQGLERVLRKNTLFHIIRHKSPYIITRESETHLRQVVRPETEELGLVRNHIGRQCCPRPGT